MKYISEGFHLWSRVQLISFKLKVQLFLYLQLSEDLVGQQLLPEVVSTLHDDRQQPPGRKVTVRRGFSDPPGHEQRELPRSRRGADLHSPSRTHLTFSSQGSLRATADGSSGSLLNEVGV